MSLWESLDKAKGLRKQNESFITRLLKGKERIAFENDLLDSLIPILEKIEDMDSFNAHRQELNECLNAWKIKLEHTNHNDKILTEIFNDLASIVEHKAVNDANLTDEYCNRWQQFLVNKYNQDYDPLIGSSPGYCYGLVVGHAIQEDSNKTADKHTSNLSKVVHHYQKNQRDRRLDQEKTKSIRISPTYYLPNPKKQAEKILAIADKHRDKHLNLSIKAPGYGHALYLRYNRDGTIDFMDPNVGHFKFNTREEFTNFYTDLYGIYQDFHSFSLTELRPNQPVDESRTLYGKLSSYLYGAKYNDSASLSNIATRATFGAIGFGVGAGVGAGVGVAVGSVVPVVGNILGGVIGGAIGGLIGGVLSQGLVKDAHKHGFHGVMGVLQNLNYRFDQFINLFTPEKTNDLSTQNSLSETGSSLTQTHVEALRVADEMTLPNIHVQARTSSGSSANRLVQLEILNQKFDMDMLSPIDNEQPFYFFIIDDGTPSGKMLIGKESELSESSVPDRSKIKAQGHITLNPDGSVKQFDGLQLDQKAYLSNIIHTVEYFQHHHVAIQHAELVTVKNPQDVGFDSVCNQSSTGKYHYNAEKLGSYLVSLFNNNLKESAEELIQELKGSDYSNSHELEEMIHKIIDNLPNPANLDGIEKAVKEIERQLIEKKAPSSCIERFKQFKKQYQEKVHLPLSQDDSIQFRPH